MKSITSSGGLRAFIFADVNRFGRLSFVIDEVCIGIELTGIIGSELVLQLSQFFMLHSCLLPFNLSRTWIQTNVHGQGYHEYVGEDESDQPISQLLAFRPAQHQED